MEFIATLLGPEIINYIFTAILGSLSAVLVGFIINKIPNAKIKAALGKLSYGAGVTMTLGLSKYKFTKGFWNSKMEPWLINFVDELIKHCTLEFIRGLKSDNQENTKTKLDPYSGKKK